VVLVVVVTMCVVLSPVALSVVWALVVHHPVTVVGVVVLRGVPVAGRVLAVVLVGTLGVLLLLPVVTLVIVVAIGLPVMVCLGVLVAASRALTLRLVGLMVVLPLYLGLLLLVGVGLRCVQLVVGLVGGSSSSSSRHVLATWGLHQLAGVGASSSEASSSRACRGGGLGAAGGVEAAVGGSSRGNLVGGCLQGLWGLLGHNTTVDVGVDVGVDVDVEGCSRLLQHKLHWCWLLDHHCVDVGVGAVGVDTNGGSRDAVHVVSMGHQDCKGGGMRVEWVFVGNTAKQGQAQWQGANSYWPIH
jgi:hypothetical protein